MGMNSEFVPESASVVRSRFRSSAKTYTSMKLYMKLLNPIQYAVNTQHRYWIPKAAAFQERQQVRIVLIRPWRGRGEHLW